MRFKANVILIYILYESASGVVLRAAGLCCSFFFMLTMAMKPRWHLNQLTTKRP